MATFGDMLKEFRRRSVLSQRGLAEKASIDTSYISRLESGEREVTSRELALRLAGILDLSIDESELWLLTAGYASPRLQQQAGDLIDSLIDEITQD